MDYLIVAATVLEIQPLLEKWNLRTPNKGEITTVHYFNDHTATILIGGVGMMEMAYYLGKTFILQRFDVVINMGIAGSFDDQFPLGSLVVVKSQQYADLGATNANGFQDFYETGLLQPNASPFSEGIIQCQHTNILKTYHLPEVKAISVNTVSGNALQIELLQKKYQPQIEVMEGIAVHFACRLNDIPYVELRAISNKVEERDTTKWQINEAIAAVNDFVVEWMGK
jgi:futalosine hydrolase